MWTGLGFLGNKNEVFSIFSIVAHYQRGDRDFFPDSCPLWHSRWGVCDLQPNLHVSI